MSATDITPFAFGENLVRIHMDENGEPWFVAKDVCRVLEIQKYRDALATLDDDEKGCPVIMDTLGGPQEMATISESGLYSLVFRSRKPEAKAFSKWVTAEVLPSLRKTGSYAMPQSNRVGTLPLPEGLSPTARFTLQTFSASRIALTERVLRLAECMGLKDEQSVKAVFDVYAAVFLDKCELIPPSILPDEVQREIWNDVKALGGDKGWNLHRQSRSFVGICTLVEEVTQHTESTVNDLRGKLMSYSLY